MGYVIIFKVCFDFFSAPRQFTNQNPFQLTLPIIGFILQICAREEFEKKTLWKDCLKEKTHFFFIMWVFFSVSFDPNQIKTSQLELWYEEVREVESAICYDVNEIHCKCLQENS